MITEILTPLDGTKAAEAGVAWVEGTARRLGSRVRLLHVIDGRGANGGQRRESEAYLDRQRSALVEAGIDAVSEIATGQAAEEIVRRANESDLTVMTSGTVRWLVSAVLDRVLQEAVRPVVIVRAQTESGTPESPKILTPIDSADYSTDVLPAVRDVAAGLQAPVVLLHVIPPVGEFLKREDAPPGIRRVLDQLVEESQALVDGAAAELREAGAEVETITEIGEPERTIVRLAESTGASLIAMATRGRERLASRMGGSVANAVMESTSVPCLFVRPSRALVG